MTYCSTCGATLPPEAAFCSGCGAAVVPTASVQPVAPAPARPRRSGIKTLLIIAAALAALILFKGFGPSSTFSLPASVPTVNTGHHVTYRITGPGLDTASLTYTNADGGTEQHSKAKAPWERTLVMPSGAFAYISAQNESEYGGVTCEILVDGTQVKTSDSFGAYTIASCSGRVP